MLDQKHIHILTALVHEKIRHLQTKKYQDSLDIKRIEELTDIELLLPFAQGDDQDEINT